MASKVATTTARESAGDEVDPGPRLGVAVAGGARTSTGRRESARVLVLNSSYEPLNVCTVRRAVVLLLKDKAEMLEIGERSLHSESMTIPHPVVIRLVTYVRIPRESSKRRITRRAVFARDSWTCQYCGSTTHLTVDHVLPRSRGGPSDWENIVTSCAPCNRRKGNRTPSEAGIKPRRKPRVPGPTVFIRVAAPIVPKAWNQYLLAVEPARA
jgi:5-methylcytosine-specific restriction endonuclease McrA